MIKIGYKEQTDKGYVSFGGSPRFYDILSLVKSRKFRFNPQEKIWETTPKKLLDTLTELGDYDDINVSTEVKNKLQQSSKDQYGAKETVFQRNKLVDKYFKYPPIQGKEPNEEFQTECIQKGINTNRYGFFLGMGSGKTFINITIFNHHFEQGICDKLLIVTPPEGVYNWRRELKTFASFIDNPDKDIAISSAQHNRDPFSLDYDPKIIIMTYRHFLTWSDDYYKWQNNGKKSTKYRKPVIPFQNWGNTRGIILDESHSLKNIQARQSKVLHIHKRFFYYRYLLTGTPSPNSFTELYSQMFFLDSGLLPDNYYEWLEDVANLGNRFSAYAVNFIYPKKQQEWEKLFSDWVTRYTSDEILDLPELYVKNIYAEMSDLQKGIYEHLINYMITILKEENDGRLEPKLLVNKFAYISLAYENANLLKGKIDPQRSQKLSKLVERFNFSKHHGKIEILDSLLDQYINNEGHKVTVFDFHPDTLEELAKRYKKYNPVVIHGQSTPKGEDQDEFRSKELDKFRNSGKHNLLLASSKVLSTAVNIVECKRVIYFSRSFSYVDYAQSIKRFHRIGQEDPVIVNNLVFENSLDVRLDKALKEKKDLDDSIFNKESLSKDEWKNIFKGDV